MVLLFNNRNMLPLIFGIVILTGCLDEERYLFSEPEVHKLITSDSIKFWHLNRRVINGQRVELTGCDKYTYYYFAIKPSNAQYNTYLSFVIGGSSDCYPHDNYAIKLDSGGWQVDKPGNPDHHVLIMVNEDRESFKIVREVTPWTLVLEELKVDSIITNRDTVLQDLSVIETYGHVVF